jgi:hypothetical protein
MPNRSVNEELITGFPPWCGSKFRIAEGPHFPLIQCNDCRRDEWIEFIDPRRKGLVTARQLAEVVPLSVDTIYRCARIGKIPSLLLDKERYFDQNLIMKWQRESLESSTT